MDRMRRLACRAGWPLAYAQSFEPPVTNGAASAKEAQEEDIANIVVAAQSDHAHRR